MAQEDMPKFEIPAEMRQMAEQSVEQAREKPSTISLPPPSRRSAPSKDKRPQRRPA